MKKGLFAALLLAAVMGLSACGGDNGQGQQNVFAEAGEKTLAAKIASADTSASSLRNCLDSFITEMDTKGAGIKRSKEICEIRADISASNVTVTADADELLSAGAKTYGGGNGGSEWFSALEKKIGDALTGIADASARFYIRNGSCVGVTLCEGSSTMPSGAPDGDDFVRGSFGWSGTAAGSTADGEVIGTSPKLGKN